MKVPHLVEKVIFLALKTRSFRAGKAEFGVKRRTSSSATSTNKFSKADR